MASALRREPYPHPTPPHPISAGTLLPQASTRGTEPGRQRLQTEEEAPWHPRGRVAPEQFHLPSGGPSLLPLSLLEESPASPHTLASNAMTCVWVSPHLTDSKLLECRGFLSFMFYFILFIFLATLNSMWGFRSPTSD